MSHIHLKILNLIYTYVYLSYILYNFLTDLSSQIKIKFASLTKTMRSSIVSIVAAFETAHRLHE